MNKKIVFFGLLLATASVTANQKATYFDVFFSKNKGKYLTTQEIKKSIGAMVEKYGVNATDTKGHNLLWYALETGNTELVTYMIETFKALPNQDDYDKVKWESLKYKKNKYDTNLKLVEKAMTAAGKKIPK